MIPAFALPALGFFRSQWKGLLVAVVLAPAVFLLGQCSGAKNEANKTKAASAVAVAAATAQNSELLEQSAGERAADVQEVTALTQELTDAVANVPDSVPAPAAVALGCQRLRASGRDVSDLPQCSGPAGGSQAPAQP